MPRKQGLHSTLATFWAIYPIKILKEKQLELKLGVNTQLSVILALINITGYPKEESWYPIQWEMDG